MIFLTLGTQLPFERLVKVLDGVAPQIDEPIFAQIGNSQYKPENFGWTGFLTPSEFANKFQEARVIVGHAGIGTILTALKSEKPLVIMARLAANGEHRNDHQLATLEQMRDVSGVHVAENEQDMKGILSAGELEPMKNELSVAKSNLISAVREEVFA